MNSGISGGGQREEDLLVRMLTSKGLSTLLAKVAERMGDIALDILDPRRHFSKLFQSDFGLMIR